MWYNKTQKDMRFFALTFDKVLVRFYLMMACVIGGLFTGQPLIAILALPLFLSAVLGISFLPEAQDKKEATINTMEAKQRQAA